MATKEISFKTKGMARDSAVSAFSPLFAYENMNMRYQTNEDNSLMAMTTEKSTKFINSLPGIVIGCCTIENQIVAFTTIKKEAKEVSTDKPDSIFLIYESTEADNEEQNIKNGYQYKLLYNGNLNFDANHPIEAIPYIETQKAKKVFWTDYKNPIRCINIATDANGQKLWKDTSFDFNLNYTTVAQGTVTKLYQPGMFPAGVIQYVATYFNKYGAESNIIWYSPLLYITPQGRAGAPDEVCSNAFKVSLNNLDNASAEYVRLYSIVRTTLDATPIVKRVVDLRLSGTTIEYTDNNTQGDTISDTELLFKEKTPFTAKTLTTKNNSLFLGNIKLLLSNILLDVKPTDEGEAFAYKGIVGSVSCTTEDRVLDSTTGLGKNLNELWSTLDYDSYKISCFKRHETYRLGVLLQYKDSSWSTVIPIGDYEMTEISDTKKKSIFTSTIDSRLKDEFMAVRPVIVYPDINQRSCMFQGAVCPTVFNLGDRRDNSPFSLMSWFCRPLSNAIIDDDLSRINERDYFYLYNWESVVPGMQSANKEFDPGFLEEYKLRTASYSSHGFTGKNTFPLVLLGNPFASYYGNHIFWLAGYTDYAEYRHWAPLRPSNFSNGEILNLAFFYPVDSSKSFKDITEKDNFSFKNEHPLTLIKSKPTAAALDLLWYIDRSIVTMHSPEILWQVNIQNYDMSNSKFRLIGAIPLTDSLTTVKMLLEATTTLTLLDAKYYNLINTDVPNSGELKDIRTGYNQFAKGLIKEQVYITNSTDGWKQPIASAIWSDYSIPKGVYSWCKNAMAFLVAAAKCVDWKTSEFTEANYNKGYFVVNVNGVSTNINSVDDTNYIGGLNYVIYPWHKSGRINGRQGQENKENYSVLKKHLTAYYKKSNETIFGDYWNPDAGISSCMIYNGVNAANTTTATTSSTIFLTSLINKSSYNKYYSNIDKIITFDPTDKFYRDNPILGFPAAIHGPRLREHEVKGVKSYPIYAQPVSVLFQAGNYYQPVEGFTTEGAACYCTNSYPYPYLTTIDAAEDLNADLGDNINGDTAPVRIQYKSLPHAVVTFNYAFSLADNKYTIVTLPSKSHIALGIYSADPFYNVKINGTFSDAANAYPDTDKGYLWLGEIYRDIATPFGGNTETQFKNHNWCIAGDAIAIPDSGTAEIKWVLGDTYVCRFESQRIEPSTEDDLNQMVDMVSFICESRINMDGVYDRNRNLKDYTYIRSTNFNKLNEVYSQTANYFRQQYVQKDDDINTFPTLIAFSLSKSLGEETDSWMNMTLNSITDADGRLGEINKLCNFNDTIIVFQKNGIEQLMYNSNVQILSTQGVPIEIANSQKVDGLRVLSDTIGCANKHALVQTDRGIYFVATDLKGLYVFTGQLANLSDSQGFRAWFKNRDSNTEWTPVSSGVTLYYYEKMGDIFYNDGEDCLAFNQPLGQFSSFYSYELGGQLVNINGKGIQFVRRLSRWATMKESETYFYELRGGEDYGKYFSESKILSSGITPNFNPASPSYTIVVANADVDKDKVFNNLEYRADVLKLDEDYDKQTLEVNKEAVKPLLKNRPKYPFDKLTVWNEYQQGSSTLSDKFGKPSNLKAKFRIWKANIPRDGNSFRGNRMRNPWIFLKLENSASNIRNNNFCKTVLHDMKVYYYEQ